MSALAKRTDTPEKDERGTPRDLFLSWHQRYNFTVDVAASDTNHKLPRYYTKQQDGLAQSWKGERVWCNPPYSRIRPWLQKAINENVLAVFLLPATTDVAWFHDLVLPFMEVHFLRGRIKFEGFEQGANFGNLIAVFNGI